MRVAKCALCGRVVWVNVVTLKGKVKGELCADCFDDLPHDPSGLHGGAFGASAGPDHNNPWQDNAIRALEGD